ncbi:MAG: hypothetical protein NTU47_16895 [Ignavibacteriales bacterium]|nr:hypothetical protein [Ignavibacteriales bacterium]
MGAVHFSVDVGLIAALKKILPLDVFVETGTFEGDTIELVLPLFSAVHSVELSEDYYRQVMLRFGKNPKLTLHLGHSADILKKLSPELERASALIWLDAHWCVADKTAGGTSQCPLLDELDAIGSLGPDSVVLIDDARLFLCPPPYPHEVSHWPRFQKVIEKVFSLSKSHEIAIANDVIMFFPSKVRSEVEAYTYAHSINWLTVLDKSRDYDVLLKQLKDKEKELEASVEKERVIDTLQHTAEDRLREVESLTSVAAERLRVAEERLRLINKMDEELTAIKQHIIYRSLVRIKRILEYIGIPRRQNQQ